MSTKFIFSPEEFSIYRSWQTAKARTTNPDNKDWGNYGGRGIRMLSSWLLAPQDFIFWIVENLGHRPRGMSLDRINNDGNYEPGNLRWATQTQQVRNSRKVTMVTAFGETKSIPEWAEDGRCSVSSKTISERLRRYGMTPEQAVTFPSYAKRSGLKRRNG